MDISIIITNHNTKELLFRCLLSIYTSLKSADFSLEIIVVDNGSADGSVGMIRSKFPKVIVIANKTNVGFGRANNIGIQRSKGEYILLLNSDTEISPNTVQTLLAFSREHPNCFVGPKLVNPDGSAQTSCGPFFSLPVVFASLFLKGDVLGITRWSPESIKKVDWVSGACIMAPKTVFLDGLLFDEDIFMYMDEIDLLYRATCKGYPVYFCPQTRVMHVGSGSSTDRRTGPILNIFKGFQLFYRKHHPGFGLVLLRLILTGKAVLGIIMGRVTGNRELQTTYEKALRLV